MQCSPSAFLETIIDYLLPYFTGAAVDIHDARAEVIDTLASYAARTRAEMLLAAQLIAFGMTTLDTLAEARTADISMSMRIRHRGCANGLNRAILNTEKALDKRLAADPPVATEFYADPVQDDIAARRPLANNPASAASNTDPDRLPRPTVPATRPMPPAQGNQQLWAGAMIDTLRQMGMPNGPPPPA